MEKSIDLSKDKANNTDMSTLLDQFERMPFPVKKPLNKETISKYIKGTIKVVTNFYNFDFSKNISTIFLYAITVKDSKGIQNPHYGLIKRLSRSALVKEYLSKYLF